MASVVLNVVGGAIAGPIGAAVGSIIGAVIDSRIVAALTPTQRIEGRRLEDVRVTTSTEGAVIPRVYGRMRIGGNVIWATDFREERRVTRQGGGGKGGGGGGGGVEVTEYFYFCSFAVALCEGPISGIGRIWADGKPFDVRGAVYRVHRGTEDEEPDPLIAQKMGANNAPAYRGTAYVVFDDLPLEKFGNRIPQLSFEVFRPLDDPESAEQVIRSVNMIPSAGEFVYATEPILRGALGETRRERQFVGRRAGLHRLAQSSRSRCAERRIRGARGLVVRHRSPLRGMPDPPGRRGRIEDHHARKLVGERRKPRRRASRKPPARHRRSRLRRHAGGFRGGAGDQGTESARLSRDLLSLRPHGRARRQHAARSLFGQRRDDRPASLSLARAHHLLAGAGLCREP